MNEQLKELVHERNRLRKVEKDTELYNFQKCGIDNEMMHLHWKAKKLRKKTEKAIFKILEDGKN